MEEPPWKKIKLSLERPYKDDNGEAIPTLLDIEADGQQIFEPPEDPTSKVGENLRRIFIERGHDFFDKQHRGAELDEGEEEPQKEATDRVQPMTPEQLFKMRVEVLPQLHIAHGELSQARDLLALLLSTPTPTSILGLSQPTQPSPISNEPPILKATVVNKPPPIQSVHAFNTELVVGGKDRGLRKAAELFKSAAESVEQSRARGEQYWVDALKIRRGNWGLIPAPLPPGSAIGRGADKTCKDFLVSFSLEESPIAFRRRAIGRVPTFDTTASVLEYPLRQQTRLQVSINITNPDGNQHTFKNHLRLQDKSFLEGSLRAAQAEVVEQEIFFALIKEGSSLPTASARVSERLVAIEVAQATEVRFELIDSDVEDVPPETSDSICDLIFSALHLLLLRAHAHVRTQRLGAPGVIRPGPAPVVEPPPILQPIVDLLQYRAFCARIHAEIGKMDSGLREAGIPTKLRLNPVGENGEQLVSMLTVVASPQRIGGEAILRIANRHTLRFTFVSPSLLTAHLPQATLSVSSVSQLTQLLYDEVSSCLLELICEAGTEMCESVHGTWFVDLLTGRTVGRWEGCALNFQVIFAEDSSVVCTATMLERGERHPATRIESYTASGMSGLPLLDWVRQTIDRALAGP